MRTPQLLCVKAAAEGLNSYTCASGKVAALQWERVEHKEKYVAVVDT